jgi:hypothetical protein
MKVGNLCVSCKGSRRLCGNNFCPLLKETNIMKNLDIRGLENFQGSSPPSIFVGSYNYPVVSVSPLVTSFSGDSFSYDNPESWISLGYEDIISFRANLLRAKIKDANVKDVDDSLLFDLSVAKRSVETEIESKAVTTKTSFSNFHQPMGPLLKVKKFEITSNPIADHRVEKIVNDDLKAVDSVELLYDKGVEISRISKILSAGLLGLERKLVPTRWSITATDDMVSKNILSEVKGYDSISEFMVFEATSLGNHYVVFLFPDSFCFELLEAWFKGSIWSGGENTIASDHEFFSGRKNYASNVTGSYYSARLAVAEFLQKIKRQAGCVIFREVYSSYILPLGVWQVRENMRNAMDSKPMKFASEQGALSYCWSRLNIPQNDWKKNSKILDFISKQKKLNSFISG